MCAVLIAVNKCPLNCQSKQFCAHKTKLPYVSSSVHINVWFCKDSTIEWFLQFLQCLQVIICPPHPFFPKEPDLIYTVKKIQMKNRLKPDCTALPGKPDFYPLDIHPVLTGKLSGYIWMHKKITYYIVFCAFYSGKGLFKYRMITFRPSPALPSPPCDRKWSFG